MKDQTHRTQRRPLAGWGLFALVGVLLCFGALNIAVRATSHKLEDGVLWEARPEGVTAADVAARGGAMAAGIRPGDVLVAIDGASDRDGRGRSARARSARRSPIRCPTPCFASASSRCSTSRSRPLPGGNPTLYVIGAAIGIFTLLVGASVRLRRPNDPATLHFFWLCLAFFGTLTFSFSRLDRLDWYFYWADVVATLLLAPLFLHFTLVFPDRPAAWLRGPGRRLRRAAVCRLPALLFAVNVVAVGRLPRNTQLYSRVLTRARPDRAAVSVGLHDRRARGADARDGSRPVGDRAPAASLDHLGDGVRRRPVRDRLRAAVRARTARVAADGAVGDSAEPRAARVCLGAHPLPPDGRRGHRQAQPRLHGGHPRDLHDLRDAAAAGGHRVSRRGRCATT